MKTFLLLVLSVFSSSLSANGYAAYQQGDYAKALEQWTELAAEGNADAALNLGHLYEAGLGTQRDMGVAFKWYLQAAQAGLASAQYQVGLLYEIGSGVASDSHEAEYWYQLALDQGFCPGEIPEPADR